MTKPANQKPLHPNRMILGSEVLRGLTSEREFALEAERARRFTTIAAARAGIPKNSPMLRSMLQSSESEEDVSSPDDFKFETIEVHHSTKRDGIASLIEPLDPGEFFTRQHKCRTHMLFRGPSGRFSHLIGWDDLADLLRTGNLQQGQLNVTMADQTVRNTDYLRSFQPASGKFKYGNQQLRKINEQGLNFLLRNGASLIINGIGDVHGKLNRFFSSVANDLGTFTNANLYVSWRDVQAFPTHWDDHDVYIMQIEGSKIWNLYGAKRKSPLSKDAEPNVTPPTEKLWTGRLESGDVLYIPRGCWHDAIVPEDCAGQGSMHVTLSFKEFHVLDIIDWVQYEIIKNWDHTRIYVPRNAESGLAEGYFRELRQAILEVLDNEPERAFDDYLRTRWCEEPNIQIGRWIEPWVDPRWSDYRLTLRGLPQARIETNTEEGTFTLAANTRLITFDLRCLDIIQHLFDNGGGSVGELREFDLEKFDAQFVEQFLIHLVKQDVVFAELPNSD